MINFPKFRELRQLLFFGIFSIFLFKTRKAKIMPRYYRKYTKTIVKAPKRPWNNGYTIQNYDIITLNGYDNAVGSSVVVNVSDSTAPSPTTIQCKHVKVYGTVCLQGNVTESGPATPVYVQSYICYIPQLVYTEIEAAASSVTQLFNIVTKIVHYHPEWIMSQKNVNVKFQGGLPGEHDVTKFTQTSGKMKRNLKSGDRLMHLMLFKNLTSAANYNRSLYFEYQYCTRNN